MTHPMIARLASTPEWATHADHVPEDGAIEYVRLVGVAVCESSGQAEEMYLIQRDDQETPIGEPKILFAGSRWSVAELRDMIRLLEKGIGLMCEARIANIDRASAEMQKAAS